MPEDNDSLEEEVKFDALKMVSFKARERFFLMHLGLREKFVFFLL